MLAGVNSSAAWAAHENDSVAVLRHDVSAGVGVWGLYPIFRMITFSAENHDPSTTDVSSASHSLPPLYVQYLYDLNRHIGVGVMACFSTFSERRDVTYYEEMIYNEDTQAYELYDRWRYYSEGRGYGGTAGQGSSYGASAGQVTGYDEPVKRVTGHSRESKRKSFFSLNLTLRAYWFNKRNVAMYSKLGLGLMTIIRRSSYSSDQQPKTDTERESAVAFDANLVPIAVEAGSRQWRGFLELSIGGSYICSAGVRYKF